jgi:hypothetical protein
MKDYFVFIRDKVIASCSIIIFTGGVVKRHKQLSTTIFMDEDMAIEIHPSVLPCFFYPISSMQNLYKNERKYRESENET